MKILFILVRMHTNLYYRIRSIKDSDISILVQRHGFSEIKDEELDIRTIERCGFLKSKFIPSCSYLKRTVRYLDPDIVFIKTIRDMRFYMSIVISRMYRKRIVLLEQEREIDPNKRNCIFYMYTNFLKIMKIDSIIVPTLDSYEIFKKYQMTVHYIPFVYKDGIDENRSSGNRIRFLNIGKFTRRKNQLFLIKAIEKIREDHNIILTIVGQVKDSVVLEELEEYVDKRKLGDFIDIVTDVDPLKMEQIYRNNDIFILPSFKEPASFSIVEAFHHGIPVLCSSDCGTRCYIDNGSNGYIFRPDSEEDLIDCIEKTIENLENMRENTKKTYLQNHQQYKFHQNLMEKKIL
jgi:glycosyltransferase involved in cell wall biosynthesis